MYTKFLNLSDVDLEKYGSYRLCYIDELSEEVYQPIDENDYSRYSPWVDNPEYEPGKREFWAYFTPPEKFDEQWGDDWDDAPYEHNAGGPYDEDFIEKEDGTYDRIPYEIVIVGFAFPEFMWVKLPKDYGCGNSPFCVRDINRGAVAWAYGTLDKATMCIQGGDSLSDFKRKLGD